MGVDPSAGDEGDERDTEPSDDPGDDLKDPPVDRGENQSATPEQARERATGASRGDDVKETLIERRRLIGGLAAFGGFGWYVYSLFDPPGSKDPEVPEDELEANGWVETEDADETTARGGIGPIDLKTARNTVTYENEGLVRRVNNQPVIVRTGDWEQRRSIRSYTTDVFDAPLAIFSATRIDFGPDVDDVAFGLGRKEIMNRVTAEAKGAFEDRLEEAGLVNVSKSGEGVLEVEAGKQPTLHEYTATYPFDGFTVEENNAEMEVPSDDIEIAGKLAVWKDGDYVIVAVGAYPNENYQYQGSSTTTGGEPVELLVDLELDPDAYEEELLEYLEAVE